MLRFCHGNAFLVRCACASVICWLQIPQAAGFVHPVDFLAQASDVSDMVQALKAVKGVLNKLTPEKFDRLLAQLLDNVKSAEILHGTISLVFENAVAQPTFVGLYAMLCEQLSKVRAFHPIGIVQVDLSTPGLIYII